VLDDDDDVFTGVGPVRRAETVLLADDDGLSEAPPLKSMAEVHTMKANSALRDARRVAQEALRSTGVLAEHRVDTR